jgi:hypothetical protein
MLDGSRLFLIEFQNFGGLTIFVEACLTEFQVNPETSKLKFSQVRFEYVTKYVLYDFYIIFMIMKFHEDQTLGMDRFYAQCHSSGPGDTAGCTSTAFRWIESRSLVQTLVGEY